MNVPTPFQAFVAAELALGDPALDDNTISFRRSMQLDEAEAFPEAMVSRLHAHRLHHYYVPVERNGALDSCQTILALARALSRRDLTLAVTYGTLLWTMLVWIGGDERLKQRIATLVLQTGVFPCLAYSEAHHGADLVANETVAACEMGEYRLSGEKWPINRATRSDLIVLLARTGKPGTRGLSLFAVDKRDLDPSSFYHLPRVATFGLRGCDISGIGFRGSRIPEDARIGPEDAGLEIALKGFQVTRTFCAGLSLGAGDTALRSVMAFVTQRRLYGSAVVALLYVRDVLANVYLNVLMAECVALVSARGMHLYPSDFSLWSAVVKIQVPALIDRGITELSDVLGARFYMRDEHEHGIFQKMLRDNKIVSVFDGSTAICLSSVATQLRAATLARKRSAPLSDDALRTLYEINAPLPTFAPERFHLFGRGNDFVLASLPQLAARIEIDPVNAETMSDVGVNSGVSLGKLARDLVAQLAELDAEVLSLHQCRVGADDPRQFALARRYCNLHTAAVCIGVWLFNRQHAITFTSHGLWLIAALQRAGASSFHAGHMDASIREHMIGQLLAQHNSHSLFSLFDVPLAPRDSREADIADLFEEQAYEP